LRVETEARTARQQVNEALGPRVDLNALRALDVLERELGLRRPDGSPLPDAALPRLARAPLAQVMSDANVIYRLRLLHQRLHEDAPTATSGVVGARLAALLERGVFLAADSGRHLAAGRESDPLRPLPVQFHAVKNKMALATTKMLRDLMVLQETQVQAAALRAQAPTEDEAGRDKRPARDEPKDGPDERVARLCDAQLDRLDEGAVTTLFDKGFVSLDRALRVTEAMEGTMGGLSEDGRKAHRAATMQGRIRGDIADFYVHAVQELRPGESLSFLSERALGMDMDGFGVVWQDSNRTFDGEGPKLPHGIRMNIHPNLQPVPSAMHKTGQEVTITRTAEGIEIGFGKVSEATAKLAAKVMWGGGGVWTSGPQPAPMLIGVLYAGVEVIPGVSLAVRTDNRMSMTIPQGDRGEMQKAVRQLFSGAAMPFRLMEGAGQVRSQRDLATTGAATVDAHVLFAGVGIAAWNENQDQRIKGVVVPTLDQVNLGAALVHKRSRATDADGTKTERSNRFEPSLRAAHIVVFEAQYDYDKAIADPQQPDNPAARIGDGFEAQTKIPAFIHVAHKTLWGRQLETSGLQLQYDADGMPQAVTMQATTTSNPVSSLAAHIGVNAGQQSAFNAKNVPQLAALLREAPDVAEPVARLAASGLQV
ncbi:MAG TPA: hypothetical protein VF457_00765, partial [Burkholderiaceae bacterium]